MFTPAVMIVIFTLVVLVLMYSIYKRKKDLLLMVIVAGFAIFMYFYEGNKKESLIEAYDIGQEIICKESKGLFYVVSQERGWRIEGKYFRKEDILMQIMVCELLEREE